MRSSAKVTVAAFAAVAILLSGRSAVGGTTETDNLVAIMVKTVPRNLEPKNIRNIANTIYCGEINKAQNDFEREDAYEAITERLRSLAASTPTVIEGLSRSFRFFPYNFEKQTLQINRGDYDWGRTAPLGSMLNETNQHCWRNPGHMMGMPHIVEALPDWKQVPFIFNIPKEEARTWFDGGEPTAELTFSINVDTYTSEPMASPKFIFRGKTIDWELVIHSGSGKEVRRLTSKPSASPPVSGAPRTLEQNQSRIVTRSFNVRKQPALAGELLSTLGEHFVFTAGDLSPDGEWISIDAPPIGKGWANAAVLARNSKPNAPSTTAPLQEPKIADQKADPKDVRAQMLMLITGLDGPNYRETEEFHNGHGDHIKTVVTTYEHEFIDPCMVKLRVIPKTTNHTRFSNTADDHAYTLRFDFKKMKRVNAKYGDQPEEGVWYGFAGGSSNPRLRKPRKSNYLTYYGEGSVCSFNTEGAIRDCNKGDDPGGHTSLPNLSKRPKHFNDAFKAVKTACF